MIQDSTTFRPADLATAPAGPAPTEPQRLLPARVAERVRRGTYRPLPVRRVYIPKPGDAAQQRPIGAVVVEQHRDHGDRAQAVEPREIGKPGTRVAVRGLAVSRLDVHGHVVGKVSIPETEHSPLYGSGAEVA